MVLEFDVTSIAWFARQRIRDAEDILRFTKGCETTIHIFFIWHRITIHLAVCRCWFDVRPAGHSKLVYVYDLNASPSPSLPMAVLVVSVFTIPATIPRVPVIPVTVAISITVPISVPVSITVTITVSVTVTIIIVPLILQSQSIIIWDFIAFKENGEGFPCRLLTVQLLHCIPGGRCITESHSSNTWRSPLIRRRQHLDACHRTGFDCAMDECCHISGCPAR
mmetsp:Transcript_101538/g.191099  ORF Transcript_101538/g.191099 Transcript_101538/m.191099 type:complete len:222 (+) Transcript_101538:679-1344(+)